MGIIKDTQPQINDTTAISFLFTDTIKFKRQMRERLARVLRRIVESWDAEELSALVEEADALEIALLYS